MRFFVSLPLSKYVWFDGKFVENKKAKVSITTHAIHYGTSIFEGIRAYWNKKNLFVFRLDEHVKRFRRSGQFYNISLNFSDKEISDAIIGICKKNGIKKSCYIRPFYFVGDYGINLHVTKKAPTNVAIFSLLQFFHFPLEIYLIKMESQQEFPLGGNSQTSQLLLKLKWVEII
jgi:branched-chain amino acid aminotransferase